MAGASTDGNDVVYSSNSGGLYTFTIGKLILGPL